MSLNYEMKNLADVIRNKSLSTDKLSISDMADKISNTLEFSINEANNLIKDSDNYRTSVWGNDYINQVGQDEGSSFHYIWRAPSQSSSFLNQQFDAKAGDVFAVKFYARADVNGDRIHFEMFGGAGYKDFILTKSWEPCYSIGTLKLFNMYSRSAIYFSSLPSNIGNVSMALPVLVKLRGGNSALLNLFNSIKCLLSPTDCKGGVTLVA